MSKGSHNSVLLPALFAFCRSLLSLFTRSLLFFRRFKEPKLLHTQRDNYCSDLHLYNLQSVGPHDQLHMWQVLTYRKVHPCSCCSLPLCLCVRSNFCATCYLNIMGYYCHEERAAWVCRLWEGRVQQWIDGGLVLAWASQRSRPLDEAQFWNECWYVCLLGACYCY